jgi:Tol biopolymer transport system component
MKAGNRDIGIVLLVCLSICSPGKTSGSQSWQQWQPPVPLSEVNSSGFNDKSPFLSFDGLTLYFSRENEPAGYFSRIFQATRTTPDGPFGDVHEITSLTSGAGHVGCPWVSPDGLRMYYYSTSGMTRFLRMSQRSDIHKAWPSGSYITELNALGSVANPTLTQDELTIVFSGLNLVGGRGDWDLWMARTAARPSATS